MRRERREAQSTALRRSPYLEEGFRVTRRPLSSCHSLKWIHHPNTLFQC